MEHMIRPKSTVLPKSALVPNRNLLQPPPNQFTHSLMSDQSYYYLIPDQNNAPDGIFLAGTQLVLLFYDGIFWCHVANDQGLYVVTEFKGLRPIQSRNK